MNNLIGKSVLRIDGVSKVTGQGKYACDLNIAGALHIKIVRATEAHAIILEIDTSMLKDRDSIFCYTGKDIPENSFGNIIKDQPVLATDKVRFYGEPVALVAAPTMEEAEYWAKQVVVSYQPLAIVEDAVEAKNCPNRVHEEKENLLQEFHFEKRSVEKGFLESDLILEDIFSVPMVDHLYMETEAGVSYWDGDILTVEAGTQNPFHDREEICRSFGLPLEKVRVKTPLVGGGFGGKDGHTVQLFLALVTIKTKKPAKLVFSREESITTSYKRHSAKMKTKLGLTKDGIINAFETEIYLDTGAYAALGPAVLGLAIEHSTGPYEIPNVKIDGYLVYTNKPPASAMRGFGAPQTLFAVETLLNRAAEVFGIDPIKIRLNNALEVGKEGSLGQIMEHSVGIKEALSILSKSDFWVNRLRSKEKFVGYGMAAGFLSCGLGAGIKDQAKVELGSYGDKYTLKVGCVDIGQGNYTSFAQLAASELGIDMNSIEFIAADTLNTHDCGTTAGSRTTFIVGNAILKAIEDFKLKKERGQVNPVGIGEAVFPESKINNLGVGLPHVMYTFITQAAKVRINPVTGEVKVLDIFAVTEAGKVLNPLNLSGQIEGGIAMSIGYCLMEQMQFSAGKPLENSLSNYLIPTSLDLCNIETTVVKSYEKSGPMGIKGAAEVSTVAMAPAITAAVAKISGYSANTLPLQRSAILEKLLQEVIN